jgi:hypothetical protein
LIAFQKLGVVPAGGIELRPVIENTEVADSKKRQKR